MRPRKCAMRARPTYDVSPYKTVLRMRSLLAVRGMRWICTHNLNTVIVLCVELYIAARLIVSHEIQAGRQLQDGRNK